MGLVGLPSDRYPTPASRAAFFDRLNAQLRTIAATGEVAVASTIPTRSGRPRPIEIDGRLSPLDGEFAQVMTAGPNYFRTLGRPTISGRDFNMADNLEAPPVVMVNDSFVAAYCAASSRAHG